MIPDYLTWEERQQEKRVEKSAQSMVAPSVEDVAELARKV